MSPVAGVITAVSDAGDCSPVEIIKRTVIPVSAGIIVMILSSIIFV
jgi:DcuC family C4-dicarboxylate transporter